MKVRPSGKGQDALTKIGKINYNMGGDYIWFGLDCGDNYIKEYSEGAMLLFGINLKFDSKADMVQFKKHSTSIMETDIFNAT